MKNFNSLLFLGLLLFVGATTDRFEFASLAELNDISETNFGKNLLETVTLSLNNGGDAKSVLNLLNGLMSKLIKEQEDSDKWWAGEKKRLENKISDLTKEIAKLAGEIEALKTEKSKMEKLINRVKENIKQYNAQKLANNKQLTDLATKRANDKADFDRSTQEHLDLLKALEQVINELVKLSGSISGVGKPNSIQEIDAEKRDAAWKKAKAALVEIAKSDNNAAIFAEMATEADQNALEKLVNLLRKLRKSAEKSYNDDKSAETRSKDNYKILVNSLESDNKKLASLLNASEKNLRDYEGKLANIIKNISNLEKVKESKEKDKKDTIKEKDLKEKVYNAEKLERTEEREVVKKLIKLVEERLVKMSSYLSSNTNA
jgi:chromosome segregation ATPase